MARVAGDHGSGLKTTMSIIEDALKKLQDKRSEGAGGAPDLYLSAKERELYEPGRANRRVLAYAVFIAAAVIVGGGVWLGLDTYQKNLKEQTRAAATIVSLEKRASTTPAPASQASGESVQERAEPSTQPAAGQTQSVSEAPAVQQEAQEKLSDTAPEPAARPETVMAIEPWIERGRQLMKEKGMTAALPVWEEGLRSLDADRLVLIPSVYEREEDAERALDTAGDESSAFAARGWYRGKLSYYLLSAPLKDSIEDEQKRLTESLSIPSVKGASAGKLTARMDKKPLPVPERAESASVMSGEASPAPVETPKPAEKKAVEQPAAPAEREAVKEAKDKPAAISAVDKEGERKREAERVIAEKYARARLMLMNGRYSAVVEEFQPEFVIPPSRWEPYFIMGSAYLGMGLLDKAEEYLKRGIAIDGRQPRLWLQLAIISQQRGNNSTALRILQEAEKLGPSLPETQLNIGYSSDALGDTNTAAKAYRLFLSLTEGDSSYVEARTEVLKRLGELGY